MKSITRALFALTALGAMTLPVALAEAPIMGPLSSLLPSNETNGAWTATTTPNSWTLENTSDPGDLVYFYLNPVPGTEGMRMVSTRIDVSADASGGAGLFYGFDPQTKFYFLLVIENDELVFYRRDHTGLNMMTSTSSDAITTGFNTLTVSERGSEIAIAVNGNEVATIENDVTGKGAVGVAAFGTGTFTFQGFDIAN